MFTKKGAVPSRPGYPGMDLENQEKKGAMSKSKSIGVFLDIDGVLNREIWEIYLYKRSKQRRFEANNPNYNAEDKEISKDERSKATVDLFVIEALACLDQLIYSIAGENHTPCIIISSDWRFNLTTEQLQDLFSAHNFSKYIVGKLDDDNDNELTRGGLIKKWMDEKSGSFNIVNFVILDDLDLDLSKRFENKFIKCNYSSCFTKKEFDQAMSLLKFTHLTEAAHKSIELEIEKQHRNRKIWDLNWYIKYLEDHFSPLHVRVKWNGSEFNISLEDMICDISKHIQVVERIFEKYRNDSILESYFKRYEKIKTELESDLKLYSEMKVRIQQYQLRSLIDAIRNGDIEKVKICVEEDSKNRILRFYKDSILDYTNAEFPTTPLAWAVIKGNLSIVRILLSAKANVNFRDIDGNSLLISALDLRDERRCFDLINELLKASMIIDSEITTKAFSKALELRSIKKINFLLERGLKSVGSQLADIESFVAISSGKSHSVTNHFSLYGSSTVSQTEPLGQFVETVVDNQRVRWWGMG